MLKRYRIRDYKFNIVITVLVLTVFGILLVGSAKPSVQNKQILGLIIGLVMMAVVSLIDYHFILSCWIVKFVFKSWNRTCFLTTQI